MANEVSLKNAVVWTAIAKYSTAVLGVVFGMILSRLLTPTQYGTVAVIQVFVVFFNLLADMGFGTAVIQNKALTKKDINDVFAWTIYISLLLQIIFIGLSVPISIFYNDSIYIPLGIILSFALFFNSANAIPNAMMLRGKKFKAIAFRTIVSCILSFLITLVFVLNGFGVYAIVISSVTSAFIVFVWNELTIRLKFVFNPAFNSIKRIWGYSVYQFISMLVNYFNRNLDTIIIGKFFTKADLGQYNKSYNLMMLPIAYLPGVVGPALHPILSDHQNDTKYIYNTYLRILKFLSLLGCFISVILFYTADELIIVMFGNQWEPACLPFKILALSVCFQLATNTVGPIYLSIGNTKLLFKSVLASCAVILSGIITGCLLGSIVTVAIGVSIGYIVNYFVTYFIMTKYAFRENFIHFLQTFWHEALIFTVLLGVTLIHIKIGNIFVSLVVKATLITIVYVILLIVTKQYKLLFSLLKRN